MESGTTIPKSMRSSVSIAEMNVNRGIIELIYAVLRKAKRFF